jgi:hypothetical protein
MNWTLILASTACIAFVAAVIDFALMGMLFHRYQRTTPDIWRPLSPSAYALNAALSLAFGFAYSVIFYLAFVLTPRDLVSALGMGSFMWAAFPLLIHLGTANRVRIDRRYVAGRLLTTFTVYLTSALVARAILF